VPFKNSKLTKLLENSIGHNCSTLMITCISSSATFLSETLSTLRFAQRAKCIRNTPVVNLDPKSKLIFELRETILKLEHDLHKKPDTA